MRGAMVTPQMAANNLPLVSPQPPAQIPGPSQQLNLGQATPQGQNQQLQGMNKQQSGQMNPPVHQRMQQQAPNQNQIPTQRNGTVTDVHKMLQGWGENQLLKSAMAVIGKLNQPGPAVSICACLTDCTDISPRRTRPNSTCCKSSPSTSDGIRSRQLPP